MSYIPKTRVKNFKEKMLEVEGINEELRDLIFEKFVEAFQYDESRTSHVYNQKDFENRKKRFETNPELLVMAKESCQRYRDRNREKLNEKIRIKRSNKKKEDMNNTDKESFNIT